MTFSISKTRELCDAATEGPNPVAWRIRQKRSMTGAWSYFPDEPIADAKSWDAEEYDIEPLYGPQALDEIERLTGLLEESEAENTRWLFRMADVREASGIGVKPMLTEVPEALAALKRERDEALDLLGEVMSDDDDWRVLTPDQRSRIDAFLSRHKEG